MLFQWSQGKTQLLILVLKGLHSLALNISPISYQSTVITPCALSRSFPLWGLCIYFSYCLKHCPLVLVTAVSLASVRAQLKSHLLREAFSNILLHIVHTSSSNFSYIIPFIFFKVFVTSIIILLIYLSACLLLVFPNRI